MNEVEKYYDQQAAKEWERFDYHRTEFAVTMKAFVEYLPPPPATILDIGGGPGQYSIALTQKCHTVTLFNLSEGNLELAESSYLVSEEKLPNQMRDNHFAK